MGKNSNRQKNDVATNRLLALERAVKELMVHFDDNNIHGLVNCVMRGWIVNGAFTDEYRRLTEQALAAMAEEQAAEARARAVRESVLQESLQRKDSQDTIVVDTRNL